MHNKELAAKLVAALEKTCPGIRHDYSLSEIEHVFSHEIAELSRPISNDNQISIRF